MRTFGNHRFTGAPVLLALFLAGTGCCGNGKCDAFENFFSCPEDCSACDESVKPCVCGDGICEPERCNEYWDGSKKTCSRDCAECGNGTCDPGETTVDGVRGYCPADCCGTCGDGRCLGYGCGESPVTCPADCLQSCGDGVCNHGENPDSCPQDCPKEECGNGQCAHGENPTSCPQDCAAVCGDCTCQGSESFQTCPKDCGYCGDGHCSNCPSRQESSSTCPQDCGSPVGS